MGHYYLCFGANIRNWGFVVVKDREMEIGFPTDVKHVAHIGWDGSGSAPSWVGVFSFPISSQTIIVLV